MASFEELLPLTDSELAEVIWENEDTDPSSAIQALDVLRSRARENDEYDSALSWAERMESIADKSNFWTEVARAQYLQGESHQLNDQLEEAIIDFKRSGFTYESQFNYSLQIKSLLRISDILQDQDKYEEMAQLAAAAREIAVREECIQEAGDACLQLASALHYKEDELSEVFNVHNENQALDVARESVRYFTACSSDDDVAHAKDMIARILYHQEKPHEALELMEEVFEYWQGKATDQESIEMAAESGIGLTFILGELDRQDEVLEVYTRLLLALESVGSQYYVCRVNMWMGDALLEQERYEEAIQAFERAKKIPEGMIETFVFHRASWQIAHTLGLLDRDLEAYEIALLNMGNFGVDPYFSESFFSRNILTAAVSAYSLEDWEGCLKVLEKLSEIPLFIPDNSTYIDFDALRAKALFELGNIQEAYDLVNTIIEGVRDDELEAAVALCYEVRGLISEKLNHPGFEKDFIFATAIYVRNDNIGHARRTATRISPNSIERQRIPAPSQWPM
jgi:tetratricopeptide (TPR) repeat protein